MLSPYSRRFAFPIIETSFITNPSLSKLYPDWHQPIDIVTVLGSKNLY